MQITTNLVRTKAKAKTSVYHYHVSVETEVRRSDMDKVFHRVVTQKERSKGEKETPVDNTQLIYEFDDIQTSIAFDGVSMLVTLKKIPDQCYLFKYKGKDNKMEIKYKNTYDLSSMGKDSTALQVCEVIMRYYLNRNFFTDGRKAFNDTDIACIGTACEVWTGVQQSLKLTQLGIFTNVDLSYLVVTEAINLVEYVKKAIKKEDQRRDGPPGRGHGGDDGRRRNPRDRRDNRGQDGRRDFDHREHTQRNTTGGDFYLSEEEHKKLASCLRKVRVTTTHMQNRQITFLPEGLTKESAAQITFEKEDGSKMTVADYFKATYGELQYPNAPCVVRKVKDRVMSYPMECLRIASLQKVSKKLDERQTAEMIKIAAKPPKERFKITETKMRELKVTENPVMEAFGIKSEKTFLKTSGYRVEPPTPVFSRGESARVDDKGSWNLIKKVAIKGIKITKWAFVYDKRCSRNILGQRGDPQLNSTKLFDVFFSFGIELNSRYDIKSVDGPEEYLRYLKDKKPEFVIFVLFNKDSWAYKEVKRASETFGLKVVTQCIVMSNFRKLSQPSFCSNLAVKVNVKMKGVNWKLKKDIVEPSTIVFGADVSHPGIGDLKSSSIVAVVSSLDSSLTKFSTAMRTQPRRTEVIADLSTIITEKVKRFYKETKIRPEKIVFIRDGVGESQFFDLYSTEIGSIKEGCDKIQKGYSPKITYIIAQKRHSIRFCYDGSPNGNVPIGTVVESIGHPNYYDFYMVTQYALQGTARPVRYHVLYDENNMQAGDLHNFINQLCYLYPRATKAVSVVAPVYFAHLAAARAKCYFVEKNGEEVYTSYDRILEDQLYYM